jgi:DMSO/TMAO reductase YedYZ molybdopterin-dependent catalytic subunit
MLGGAPTPITAVGSRVIDFTPAALKDFAIRTLGENDKPALLAGIYTVLALLAAATGVVAWRSRRLALGLTTMLGVVGLVAALADPTMLVGTYEKAMPALFALGVSVGALAWLTRGWGTTAGASQQEAAPVELDAPPRGTDSAGPSARMTTSVRLGTSDAVDELPTGRWIAPATEASAPQLTDEAEAPAPPGFDRRRFLASALATGVVAATGFTAAGLIVPAGAQSRQAIRLPTPTDAAGPVPPGANMKVAGLTPYLTPSGDFYRVDTALAVPQIDAAKWRLRITGMVDRELDLSFAYLVAMPLVERRITLVCVSNEVGGEYISNATWIGVPITALLDRAGVQADADAVKTTAVDGFTIGTPLAALTDGRDAMLAIGFNGEPLPLERGFPARMIVPGLYGYVSATKWLIEIEVTRFDAFNAYWTDRGWDEQAPVKTMSRIDVPRGFQQLDAGPVTVAGVAWAQNTGIDRVEIRVDGGPWQQARLSTEDSIDTWRQWVLEWDATPGSHQLEVRATDQSGYTQTPDRVPPRPNGATGWHNVVVNVT